MNYHFIKVSAITPSLHLADCLYNADQITKSLIEASHNGASVAIYPELSLTGYSCADLFFQSPLLKQCEQCVKKLLEDTQALDILFVIGAPIMHQNALYNGAIVCCKGKILGIVTKTCLPNYGEFYEKRWFASSAHLTSKTTLYAGQTCPIGEYLIFNCSTIPYFKFAVEICEDLWSMLPPSSFHAMYGATVIANLSASNEIIGKSEYRKQLVAEQSAKTKTAYIYTSSGVGESTTDLVFSGHRLIYENGYLLQESILFEDKTSITYAILDLERLIAERIKQNSIHSIELLKKIEYIEVEFKLDMPHFSFDRVIDPHPFIPSDEIKRKERFKYILEIQAHALAQRMNYAKANFFVLGMSGGLDSTLALLVCVKAAKYCNLSYENIMSITMPGFGTSNRTYENAISLMRLLKVNMKEISIVESTLKHLKDIEHPEHLQDTTYENAQARERTQILMDIANKYNGLVIGTCDLSELALGWATFNGDHMSMYGVNSSIPKTLVRHLINYIAHYESEPLVQEILLDILDTPVSPELLPVDKGGEIAQKTEDLVGPYELHDFFIYYALRFMYSPAKIYFLAKHAFNGSYTDETLLKWLKIFYTRFFKYQFKRSSMPDSPKVGSICLSPRGDLRMPSDAYSTLWLKELENLQ